MFDLKHLDRWSPVGATAVKFRNTDPRKVRLEVLSEGEAKLYVQEGKRKQFIGTFDGYDVVQFSVNGPWELTGTGKVQFWCSELDGGGMVEIPDAVSFTRIMTRRVRNPELELMMHKVTQNVERRLEQVGRDFGLQREADKRDAARALEAERKARKEAEEAKAVAEAAERAARASSGDAGGE